MDLVIALAINGLIWGLVIALIALGLSIIFGLLDIINLAHGDFFMVGTVLAWSVVDVTGNFWLALVLVPILGLVFGAVIQRVVIVPIQRAAALTIVATFGLSIMLQEGVRATFGAAPKRLLPPIEATIPLFGIEYELYRVFAAVIALSSIIGFFVFLHKSKLGTWMRAVRHDRETATALGIPVERVYTITFALGFAMAALGGVVAAPITTVDFRSGVDILPFCFMAVIIGGLGNLQGTAVAAVLLAFLEGVITAFAEPVVARITSLCLMSAVLLLRPKGIFAGATA
ncbi:branched-chain amino acid ABC transporter permease [Acuticoccus sp. I52.16.1]|uniref:branched-chain amino acid ABC transporter permease n=1 Tax=Acuticoccus sp. I52.16.1 TaxID=2928472 RepID=UPI001FD20FE5|nr:branched-chain amino acid ABC transporter permease [Acuticoccus sp. I52.16.1]UOM35724.1 branched-chain amino acid ABC transporter permease [Acuticoccus sp. I52.16.1]